MAVVADVNIPLFLRGIEEGENTYVKLILDEFDREVPSTKKPDTRQFGVQKGSLLNLMKNAIAQGLHDKDSELLFEKQLREKKFERMKLPARSKPPPVSGPKQPYPPSDAISKALRYFSVRNRSDDTQHTEERQITLKRSLFDASRKIDLAKEADRRKTFTGWQYDHIISKDELAARGFAYLGDADRVQCVFCKGVLRDWSKGDEALKEHHKHFPTCPFILRLDVGNEPIAQPWTDADKVPTNCTQPSPNKYEPDLPIFDITAPFVALEMDHWTSLVRHPAYASITARCESYRIEGVPAPSVSTFAAAFAGFYRDAGEVPMEVDSEANEMEVDGEAAENCQDAFFVRCYACDIRFSFNVITPNESATWWEQHARRSPFCPHLRKHWGSKFNKSTKRLNVTAINAIPQVVGNRRHRVEPREVRARLDMPLYTRLQELMCPKLETMSQTRELLSYLIDQRLEVTGKDFDSIHDGYVLMHNFEIEYNAQKAEFPEMTMTKFLNEKKEEVERQREELKLRSARAQSTIERDLMEKSKNNPLVNMDENQLSEFNRQLKDNRTCKICMDHIVNTVFLPCGHLVTCHECAPKVKTCPVCRLQITSTVLTTL